MGGAAPARLTVGKPTTAKPRTWLRRADVEALLGLGKTSFWAMRSSSDFPRPRVLPNGKPLWSLEEVERWLDALPRGVK